MWFTETPWPPIFISIAAMVLLLAAWYRNARNLYLLGAVGLGLACVAIYCFEKWYVTENETGVETVESHIPELAKAVEADNVDDVLRFFAEENEKDRKVVRSGLDWARINGSIRITDVQVRYNDDRSAILSHFRANGEASLKGNSSATRRFTTRWELTWKLIGDEWKIVHMERLDPMKKKKTVDPLDAR